MVPTTEELDVAQFGKVLHERPTVARCQICGEPMPEGETMFKFHGFSGPCPKPPLPTPERHVTAYETLRAGCKGTIPAWDALEPWMRDAVKVAYLQGTLDATSRS